jgi:hypothetical protein
MTAPTNTIGSTGTPVPNIGIREDLENSIYRVAPESTPFISNIGSTKATNVFHEWQTETLATPVSTNAQLEGDDYTLGAANLTTRVGNYMQIVAKTGGVSRTQEVVDKAGRDSELARQKVLKTIEVKRDLEMRLVGNYASVVESGATTRKSAGMLAFLTTNTSKAGSDGGFSAGIVAAATNGTQRTFTEALVKSVMARRSPTAPRPPRRTWGRRTSSSSRRSPASLTSVRRCRARAWRPSTAPPTCTCRTSGR